MEGSLSTCEMAHWAAAMAVLATEAALMRLPSLEAMSLGRMSETGSEIGAPPAGGQAGKGHKWGSDLLEPLANSTLMVLPSMVSGGCRACRICSSWAASWGRRGGRGRRVRPGEAPGSIAPLPGVGPRWGAGVRVPPPHPGGRDPGCPAPPVPPSPRWWRAG